MNRIDELIQESERLMREQPEGADERISEIVKELKAMDSPEVREKVKAMTERQFAITGQNVKTIEKEIMRLKIDDTVYKLTPWRYIANTYFKKSAAWLSQRINGTPVRGQVYTLNEEQKATLNRAMKEVGEMIGSYRFA